MSFVGNDSPVDERWGLLDGAGTRGDASQSFFSSLNWMKEKAVELLYSPDAQIEAITSSQERNYSEANISIIERKEFSEKESALAYLGLSLDCVSHEEISAACEKLCKVMQNKKEKLPPFWSVHCDMEIGNFERARDFLLENDF